MSLPLRPSTRPSEPPPPAAPRPLRTLPGEVPPGGPAGEQYEPIIDAAHVRDLLAFPLRAVERHRRLALTVGIGMVALTAVAAVVVPRSYGVMTTIVAQKNIVMPALDNPKRTIPAESDAPTKLAAEAVLSRDNLENIVQQTNLLAAWPHLRSPLGMMRERVMTVLRGPLADSERVDLLIETLKTQLWVATNEGTVSIGINAWPDPVSAQRIVQAAQQNFLEQRHSTEMSMIGESIAILERHVESAQESIEQSLTELAQALGPEIHRTADSAPRTPVEPPPRHSAEIAGLQAELTAKRSAIQDVEASRNQALASLHVRLDQLRSQYGPAHPEITATLQDIQEVSGDSPQLLKLRTDAKDLESRLLALGAVPGASSTPSPLEPILARAALERLTRVSGRVDTLEDPRITYSKSRLKIAVANYEDFLDRLEGAQIELETARAAFKYRYTIVTPPEVPRRPMKPNLKVLIGGGLTLAVILAIFAATGLDVVGGRVYEAWQIERQLGLPVFGKVQQP